MVIMTSKQDLIRCRGLESAEGTLETSLQRLLMTNSRLAILISHRGLYCGVYTSPRRSPAHCAQCICIRSRLSRNEQFPCLLIIRLDVVLESPFFVQSHIIIITHDNNYDDNPPALVRILCSREDVNV